MKYLDLTLVAFLHLFVLPTIQQCGWSKAPELFRLRSLNPVLLSCATASVCTTIHKSRDYPRSSFLPWPTLMGGRSQTCRIIGLSPPWLHKLSSKQSQSKPRERKRKIFLMIFQMTSGTNDVPVWFKGCAKPGSACYVRVSQTSGSTGHVWGESKHFCSLHPKTDTRILTFLCVVSLCFKCPISLGVRPPKGFIFSFSPLMAQPSVYFEFCTCSWSVSLRY